MRDPLPSDVQCAMCSGLSWPTAGHRPASERDPKLCHAATSRVRHDLTRLPGQSGLEVSSGWAPVKAPDASRFPRRVYSSQAVA